MVDVKAYLVLIILALLIPIGFLTSLFVAIGLGHVNKITNDLATIDFGRFAPENGIFAQFVDVTVIIAIFIAILRYYHVKKYADPDDDDSSIICLSRTNQIAFGIMVLTAIFAIISGNFSPSDYSILNTVASHSALALFHLYCCIQMFISFKLSNVFYSSKGLLILRSALSLFGLMCIVLMIIFTIVCQTYPPSETSIDWKRRDREQQIMFLMSILSRWSLFMIDTFAILTLIPDFMIISLIDVVIEDKKVNRRPKGNVVILINNTLDIMRPRI